MANTDTKMLKILSGSKTTRKTNEKGVQSFLQGTEITQIGLMRSGLPILGRNPRYSFVDTTITGSISDKGYFTDVESSADAGLGQDTYFSPAEGTLYHRPGWVLNGQINLDPDTHGQIRNARNNLINQGYSGADLDARLEGYVRSVLKSISSEWEVGEGYIDGVYKEEVYYVAGTYKAPVLKADVKFPDGKVLQTINFALGSEDYGFGPEHVATVPYFDLQKYDAIKYVNESGPTGMEPIIGNFPSYSERLSFNGIIEPFEIRRRALGLNIFLEDEGQPGAIVAFNDPVITDFSYDSRENDLRAEFFEDVHVKGFAKYGSALDQAHALLEPEFVSNYSKPQFPFKERDNADLLISDSGIESIQLSMDPTLDEGTLPVTHVDMTVGFDAESRDRVNSIVYRGMTRR
jgi:hypothetical protein